MPEISVDDTRWPVVVIRFPKQYTQADFDEYIRKVLACAHRAQPFVIVNDARGAQEPNAVQRAQVGRIATTDPDARRYVRALAIIVDKRNPVLGLVATAITWMSPAPYPFKHFTTAKEGEDWALKHLTMDVQEAGID